MTRRADPPAPPTPNATIMRRIDQLLADLARTVDETRALIRTLELEADPTGEIPPDA